MRKTYWPVELQLSRVYSRAVFNEFREEHLASTRFRIRSHPEKPNYYLVEHREEPKDFPWLQHEYLVKAIAYYDVERREQSEFSCECMRWEHRGNEKNILTNLQQYFCNVLNEKCTNR